jgi:thioredoxin 1
MAESFNELLNSETPTLVDFKAEWCGPCHAMAPVLKTIAARNKERLRVIKVDIDKNPMAAAQFKIRGVPTFILFHKGNILWRQSGAMSEHTMQDALDDMLEKVGK